MALIVLIRVSNVILTNTGDFNVLNKMTCFVIIYFIRHYHFVFALKSYKGLLTF